MEIYIFIIIVSSLAGLFAYKVTKRTNLEPGILSFLKVVAVCAFVGVLVMQDPEQYERFFTTFLVLLLPALIALFERKA